MTHTPAPWKDGISGASIIAPKQECDADIKEFYGGYVVAESIESHNKPLIKAAPDLLALLIEWLDTPFFEKQEHDWTVEFESHVKAAIASAAGDDKASIGAEALEVK